MSKTASGEVKKFFRDVLGLKVRVNTVAVKNPLVQVSLIPIPNDDFRAPLAYEKTIPVEFGQRLLDVIYGGKTENIRFPAGNVHVDHCSMRLPEWEAIKKLYNYTPPAK